ncbi:MAG: aminoglycoside phosphotransferase family protein [candidate division KSB1 bacterium]|nr:aminoglycoside phosphotransferase family protein [candidate division KSB1 bacterium]MDZ7273237.1 aminoglycoside phosphotransferase family protein [candidate division KSB1 bacterium]MDZ7285339.1 aminoglycoside phosphotransferase family protein [candidate division KSB1 bacterium]MDZ7298371.1 aminoglycoside phosphotransferase family protein [candidate division KSB1 bacterium]MDZ7306449.1 aminoglycoside phosphotransferase family protein [candidate division KSB1 bacterium]
MPAEFLHQDAHLPHLPTLTDPAAMVHVFNAHRQRLPLLGARTVRGTEIEKIYYRPGRHLSVLYRVHLDDGDDCWLFASSFPARRAEKQFHKAQAMAGSSSAAPDFWPEWDMVLWPFPGDDKMPALQQLVQPAVVASLVEQQQQAFGLDGSWRVQQLRLRRVKYMPRKRCVLRYDLLLGNAAGGSRPLVFFSKSHGDAASRRHFENTRRACQALAGEAHGRPQTEATGNFEIPRPVLLLAEFDTFWQEEWHGRPVLEVLAQEEWQTLFAQIARRVAHLHLCQVPDLRPAESIDGLLTAAELDAGHFIHLLPQHAPACERVLAALRTAKHHMAETRGPLTLVHGALRLEQLLSNGDRFALLDWDALAQGDPLADLAEFIASLRLLEFSLGWERPRLQAAARQLCETYAGLVPWPLATRRLAWYALAFWIGKMHLAVVNLDYRIMARFPQAWAVTEEWLAQL